MATIRKRGNSWHVQVRLAGRAQVTKSFQSKAEATRWAREQEGKPLVRSQAEETGPERVPEQPTTFGSLLERYRELVLPTKRSAGPIEQYHLRAALRHPIAELRLPEVTSAALARYRDDRLRQVASGTVNRELGLLQHALKLAREEWSYSIPPTPLKKPAPGRARERRLSDEELVSLNRALERCRNKLVKPVFLFALATGMRRGEVLALRWPDVNLTSRTAFLPLTKNGSSRTVPLSPAAFAILGRLQRTKDSAGGTVFPITATSLRLAWARAKARAGIEDLRFHDLRHEAISRFFELGLSVPEVSLISGHKDARMLFRYTHLKARNIAEKLSRLDS